jgi:hypothetical protein
VRQIVALSVALVASLVGAYLTWTDETEVVSGEAVEVYAASDKDLQKLVWDTESVDVTVERRKDERGEYLWIESTETRKARKPPKKPDPHDHEDGETEGDEPASPDPADPASPEGEPATEAEPEPEPEPEPTVTTTRFLGNAKAQEMWTAFAPLRAPRQLDSSGTDLSKFGLGPPGADAEPAEGEEDAAPEGDDPHPVKPKKAPERATVEVVRSSGPLTLTVGGETYGAKHRYVQHGDAVFLIEQELLKPLSTPRGLIEQSLFPFEEADIAQVDVALRGEGEGTSYVFVQQNRDDRAKAYWARQEALDQDDGTVRTWLGKVFKLRLREYVDEAEVQGPLVPVVTYTVKGKGEEWPVEIVKATTTSEEGEEKTEWYARSAYNRSLVSLTESLARNVIDDLDSLAPAPVP